MPCVTGNKHRPTANDVNSHGLNDFLCTECRLCRQADALITTLGAEYARLENAGRSKMHGHMVGKRGTGKTQQQTAGRVNAGKGMYGKPKGALHLQYKFRY